MSAKFRFLEKLFSLHGRTAIVTGGGTGIGFAIAQGLAQAGASVIITGRRETVLEQSCADIRSQLQTDEDADADTVSHRANFVPCDVTDFGQLPELVKEAEYLTGKAPTILVNNAGVNVRQPVTELTSEHWYETLRLMLMAPAMLTRAMAPRMQDASYGRVINIASLQSYMAFPHSMPYAAAKSGTLGLTRALAEAYAPVHGYNNITCNALAPGYLHTELTQSLFEDDERAAKLAARTLLGRNSVPDDLVGAAIFLASDASNYVTGQTILVDGGFAAYGLRW